ncbi:MAG: L-lactate dehydrogenase [Clostridia bacterium]|nr:L-lactate dehydrogenase [Clostridia bacterium]
MNKIVIVGCSNVGMAYAHNIVLRDSNVDELVLIDLLQDKTIGEAIDLNHTLAFTNNYIKIKHGDYSDCKDATLVVICAGRNQKKGETRQELIDSNIEIIDDILENCVKNNFNGIYIIVSNPVDVLSLYAYKKLKIDSKKVIGSGTTLDTARLQYIIGNKLGINPKYINAFVLGEHGDSEMIAWDSATIANKPIKDFLTKQEMEEITHEVKNSAYEIINRKGYTNYGIGSALFKITTAILSNESFILPISVYDEKNDVYYSRPAIIGRNGINEIIDIDLSKTDAKNLKKSIDFLKEMRDKTKIK